MLILHDGTNRKEELLPDTAFLGNMFLTLSYARGVAGCAWKHKHQNGTKHVTGVRRLLVCSSSHLVMKNTKISSNEWSLSVGKRIQNTNGRTAVMRASGRSIPRKCDVWEHDDQNGESTMLIHLPEAPRTRRLKKTHKRPPSCSDWIQDPTRVVVPAA